MDLFQLQGWGKKNMASGPRRNTQCNSQKKCRREASATRVTNDRAASFRRSARRHHTSHPRISMRRRSCAFSHKQKRASDAQNDVPFSRSQTFGAKAEKAKSVHAMQSRCDHTCRMEARAQKGMDTVVHAPCRSVHIERCRILLHRVARHQRGRTRSFLSSTFFVELKQYPEPLINDVELGLYDHDFLMSFDQPLAVCKRCHKSNRLFQCDVCTLQTIF